MADDLNISASSYFDHLEVFRKYIIVILVFLVFATIISFIYIENIMMFLQKPISGIDIQLNYFRPQEKLVAYFKIAFFSGLFFTVPFGTAVMGRFIFPGLKESERRFFVLVMIMVPLVFLVGAAFAYGVITPLAFEFLVNFAKDDNVKAVWGIDAYFSFLTTLVFITGIIFLLPLGMLALMKLRLINPETVAKFRPYIIIGILVIAAFFTPPDVVSQILVAVPLYLLFELSVFVGKIIY